MPITLNGSGTVTGVSVGGLPDGIVDTDMIAANAVTAAKATGSAKGITMMDQWRLTTQISLSSGAGDLTSNWERNDHSSFSGIGSAMTESSGLFSFPVTGIYLIMVEFVFVSSGATYQGFSIRATQDNGSNYSNIGQSYGGSKSNSGSEYDSVVAITTFDVTDVSTHKFKIQYEVNTAVSIDGNSTTQRSGFTIIRLGDT